MKTQIQGYPAPKTNTQEVLLQLILYGEISLFTFPYLAGYRTRVSELVLTHGIGLEKEFKTEQNKFGNIYTYTLHKLPEEEKQKAIDLYSKLTNIKT